MNPVHEGGPFKAMGASITALAGGVHHSVARINTKAYTKEGAQAEARAVAHVLNTWDDMAAALEGLFEHTAMIHKHWGEGDNTQQANAAVKNAEAALRAARTRSP